METTRIKILLKLIEHKSMNQISEMFGYTPSGITHMMNSFEKELGIKLLHRTNQGVKITPEGEQLLPIFKKLISAENTLFHEIDAIKTQSDSTIKIGAYSSIAQVFLSSQLREFKNLYPEVKIDFSTTNRPNAYACLDNGQYDFIFVGNDKNHDFITLWKEPYYAVFPPYYDKIIDNKESIDISILEEYPFIMPSYGADTDAMDILLPLNLKLNSSAVVGDNATILSMISHGFGVSMISEIVLNVHKFDVFAVLISPTVIRDLGVAYNKERFLTPTKKLFLDYIVEKNKELS